MVHGEKESEGVRAAEVVLREAGFDVSQSCYSRPSCFDFASRKGRDLIFVKVSSDVGSLSLNDSLELRVVAGCVSASSLLIGEKARGKRLADDTVYSRYGVLAINPRTFANIVLRGLYPIVQAGPGGYYIEIDGEAVKRKRQELGLSVGEMAEMIGTSRRTLYGYERGMAKASVAPAYNLIYTLGIPIAKSVDVFERSKNLRQCFLTRAKLAIARHQLLNKISRKLGRYHVTAVKRAPFDFFIDVPEENMRILGGVADGKERDLDRRVDEILSVGKIVQAHVVLITDGQKPSNKNILCLYKNELSRIRDAKDFIDNFR